MTRKSIIFGSIIWLAWFGFGKGAAPILFFSDLTDGPISGWEKSDSVGAAVTIWGLNFGDTRGTSYLTCGGVNLTSDSNYVEWGVVNRPATAQDSVDGYTSARNLERTTFHLDSTMTAGASSISVTTSEGISNWLPFYCRETGNIYFINRDGDDSDSGWYADTAGHGAEGPWKLATKVKNLDTGDIAYFREGIWNELDAWSGIIAFGNGSHGNGTENNSITMASYPGEFAQLGPGQTHAITRFDDGILSYWTFSKFMFRADVQWGISDAEGSDHIRFIGNDYTADANVMNFDGGDSGLNCLYFYGNNGHDAGKSVRNDSFDCPDSWPARKYPLYIRGYGVLDSVDIGWNEFGYNQIGRGTQIYGHASGDYVDNLFFHDNYIHHSGCHGVIFGGGDGGTYTMIKNAYIWNNIVAQNGKGRNGNGVGFQIVGGPTSSNFYIYNNTFYHNDVELTIFTQPLETLDMKNNIIWANGEYFDLTGPGSGCAGTKNAYYGASDIPGWDTGSLSGLSPNLVNPANGNFHLQAASPCVDSASTITLTTPDYEGIKRPQGSAYDIGAYEYTGNDPKKYLPIRK